MKTNQLQQIIKSLMLETIVSLQALEIQRFNKYPPFKDLSESKSFQELYILKGIAAQASTDTLMFYIREWEKYRLKVRGIKDE